MAFVEFRALHRRRHCWWKTPEMMACWLILLLAYVVAVQSNPCLFRNKRAFPHEESCSKYLICKRGVPEEHNCPDDMNFDIETLNCEPSPVAQCHRPKPYTRKYVERKPLPTVPPTPPPTCKPPDNYKENPDTTKTSVTYTTQSPKYLTINTDVPTSEDASLTTEVLIPTSNSRPSSIETPVTPTDARISTAEIPVTTDGSPLSTNSPSSTIDVQTTTLEEHTVASSTATDDLTTRHTVHVCNNNSEDFYVVPDPEYCKHFYFCIFGTPIPAKCNENDEFSPIHLECLPAAAAGCNGTTTTTPVSIPTTNTVPLETTTSETSNITPDAVSTTTDDISSSDITSTEIISTITAVPYTTTEVVPVTTESSNSICNKTLKYYVVSNAKNCRRYYLCAFGLVVPVTCPLNYEFSPRFQVCLPPPIAGCSSITSPTPATDAPVAPDTATEVTITTPEVLPTTAEVTQPTRSPNDICKNKIENYNAPDPKDCKYFYMCISGAAFHGQCPGNKEFSPIFLKCLPSAKAGCNRISTTIVANSTTPVPTTVEPTQSPISTTTEVFTKSTEAISSTTTVPNTTFNTPTTITETTDPGRPSQTLCKGKPEIDFVVPDPRNCEYFYNCIFGISFNEKCPKNYHFSAIELKCVPAAIAGCNHTTTPKSTTPISPDTTNPEILVTATLFPTVTQDLTALPDTTVEISTPSTEFSSTKIPSTNTELPTTVYTDSTITAEATYSATAEILITTSEGPTIVTEECSPTGIGGCMYNATTLPGTISSEAITTTEIPSTTSEVLPSATEDSTTITMPSDSICNNPDKFYVVPDVRNCKHFILCVYGKVIHEKCPKNYKFSVQNKECLPPELVECNRSAITTPVDKASTPLIVECNQTTTPVLSVRNTNLSTTTAEDPIKTNEIPMTTTGLITSKVSGTVNTLPTTDSHQPTVENLSPKTTLISSTLTTAPNPSTKCDYTEEQPVYNVPDEENCRKYYTCYYGDLNKKTCPKNFKFSPIYMVCLPPHRVQCKTQDINIKATASHDVCVKAAPVHYYPDKTDCNAYNICFHGISFHQKCPHRYSFSQDSLKCVPDDLSKCSVRDQ